MLARGGDILAHLRAISACRDWQTGCYRMQGAVTPAWQQSDSARRGCP